MKAILNCYDTREKARDAFDKFIADNAFFVEHCKLYVKDLRVELPGGAVVFFQHITSGTGTDAIVGGEYTWVTFDPNSHFPHEVRVLCWSRVRLN